MNASLSAEELAFQFIKKSGGKAHISAVIDHVLSRKEYAGKTPRKTVSARIGKSPRIKVVNRYCLI